MSSNRNSGPSRRNLSTVLRLFLAAMTAMAGCGGGARQKEIVTVFEEGGYAKVLEMADKGIQSGKVNDKALHHFRCASAAMMAGQRRRASEAMAKATEIACTFEKNGDASYQTRIPRKESDKTFRGDPYEQMMAFFYMGLLEYMDGHFGRAQANLKWALLADSGTRDERFHCDSMLVWLMRARALQRMGEHDMAREALDRGRAVPVFRWSVVAMQETLPASSGQVRKTHAIRNGHLERELVAAHTALANASVQASLGSKNPTQTLLRCRKAALERIWQAAAMKPGEERREVLRGLNPDRIAGWVEAICDQATREWTETIKAKVPAPDGHDGETVEIEKVLNRGIPAFDNEACKQGVRQRQATFTTAATGSHNVLLLVEVGRGPMKYATGKHGSVLRYAGIPCPVARVKASLAGQEMQLVKLGDVRLQATTRGGRYMDHVLKGRAVFKDTTALGAAGLGSASVALGLVAAAEMAAAEAAAASAATATTTATASGASTGLGTAAVATSPLIPIAVGIAGAAVLLWIISAATNPAADTRYWELLPDSVYVGMATLPAGTHSLQVQCLCAEGKAAQVVVEESKKVVASYQVGACDIPVEPGKETVVLLRAGPFSPPNSGAKGNGLVATVPLSR